MQNSYVQEETLNIRADIQLGEVAQLIDVLNGVVESDDSSWQAKDLLQKLKKMRRSAIEDAHRDFANLLERT